MCDVIIICMMLCVNGYMLGNKGYDGCFVCRCEQKCIMCEIYLIVVQKVDECYYDCSFKFQQVVVVQKMLECMDNCGYYIGIML